MGNIINQKFSAIKKLKALGINDEKSLQSMDFDVLIGAEGVTMQDLKIIYGVKKASKSNRLFSYLMEDDYGEDKTNRAGDS